MNYLNICLEFFKKKGISPLPAISGRAKKYEDLVFQSRSVAKPTKKELDNFFNNNFEYFKTLEFKKKEKEFKKHISSMLNDKAKELGFDTFYTASAYLTQGDNPLKASAEKLGSWGGSVWGKSMKIQAQVQSGDMDMPQTWEELKGLLPQWKE